jgi:acetyl-CoA acetyltransferase
MLIAQQKKNEAAWASLYDDLSPDANTDLQAALNQVKQERQQLFNSLATQRNDVTDAELSRLNEFYGPLNPDKINPLGGAIALGHPLGATGAIRAATVVHGLRRRQQRYGMVTMCVGMGQGAAGIFERV